MTNSRNFVTIMFYLYELSMTVLNHTVNKVTQRIIDRSGWLRADYLNQIQEDRNNLH